MLKYIDLVIASAEEGVAKPDLRIFNIALERANCKPEEAIIIGDIIDNDIVPANKIGIKPCGSGRDLADLHSRKPPQKHLTIQSIV